MSSSIVILGTVFSKTGPDDSTSGTLANGTYRAGTDSKLSMTDQYIIIPTIAFDAASSLTDLRLKIQGRRTGGLWFDMQSVRVSDGNVSNEQIWLEATVGAGASVEDMVIVTSSYSCDEIQVVGEGTGGATKAGDSIVCQGRKVVSS